jgi:DNA-binding CsgD family transcriptional regulator
MVAFVPRGREEHGSTSGDQPARDLPPAAVRATIEEDSLLTKPLISGPDDRRSAERRSWVPNPGCRIIACVDVEPVRGDEPAPTPNVLWDLAMRRMEGAVRPGDWICMLGGSRLAVCFGNGAHRIPPSALGRRLARAMGDHLVVGPNSTEVEVAVGIGVAPDDLEPAAVTGAALASIRSARHHRGAPSDARQPFVAISRLPAGTQSSTSGTPDHRERLAAHWTGRPRLVRRVVVPLSNDGHDQPLTEPHEAPLVGSPTSHHTQRPKSRDALMRVLVVDPEPHPPRAARLGAAAVATMTRRVGAMPTVSTSHSVETVMLDHYVVEPHVVVVVLHPEPAPPLSKRRPDPWEEAARLTRSLVETGSSVIAVSFGASAMAVAACVEEGATGLFDLDALPAELTRLAQKMRSGNGNGQGNGNGSGSGAEIRRFPAPYNGLVELTPAERRVLHQMMRGRNATEIAAEQVVALSTVRTHIRSILRKLNVNSQLAAVAIANGSIPLEASSAS